MLCQFWDWGKTGKTPGMRQMASFSRGRLKLASLLLIFLCLVMGNMSGLSAKRFEEMRASFAKAVEGVVCPQCNSAENVIATIRGKPGPELMQFVRAGGNAKLGSCTSSSRGFCKACSHIIEPSE